MERRRMELTLTVTFLALLALHLWLLSRMVVARNALLAALLLAAIVLFLWRIAVHANRYRRGAPVHPSLTPEDERRRIRIRAPALTSLLALHAWLLWLMVLEGEILFATLLLLAVGVFLFRIGWYGWRWRALRRTPPGRAP